MFQLWKISKNEKKTNNNDRYNSILKNKFGAKLSYLYSFCILYFKRIRPKTLKKGHFILKKTRRFKSTKLFFQIIIITKKC